MESALGISRSVLYSRVKSLSKMTPGELIIHVRIQFAAHLLNSTELTVAVKAQQFLFKCMRLILTRRQDAPSPWQWYAFPLLK